MSTKVVFYCHGTQLTGLGHFSRCLNIAKQIQQRGVAVSFYGEYDDFAKTALARCEITHLPHLAELSLQHILVCDDYHFDYECLLSYRTKVKKLVVLDDFDSYNFGFIDLIINFRYRAEQFCKHSKRHLLGLNYFPFSQDLVSIRNAALERQNTADQINKILIFIGANDRYGIALRILNALDSLFENKTFWLVAKEPLVFNSQKNEFKQTHFIDNMATVYQFADFVISGGGLTKYEAGFCLIPNCALSQTSAQQQDTKILASGNLSFDLGLATAINDAQLYDKLKYFYLFELETQRHAMAAAFDSNSSKRLAEKIIGTCNE